MTVNVDPSILHSQSFSLYPYTIQLKVLKVVTKNLADPAKSKDEKYLQLKLDNEKIQQKLIPCNPHALRYLQSLGFVQIAEENVLRVVATVNLVATQGALEEVSRALERLLPSEAPEQKKPKLTEQSSFEKLSEKQKARRLLEEKQQKEKEEARLRRKATAALIKQDAYVRKNDENWTSQPSAACAKTGSTISTFRDRHGEN